MLLDEKERRRASDVLDVFLTSRPGPLHCPMHPKYKRDQQGRGKHEVKVSVPT